MLHSFLIALQFLTRLPVFTAPDYSPSRRRNALLFYPLVGLLIGALLLLIQGVLVSVEPLLGAAIILGFWVMLTGGLHLDGLADSADAWAGGLGEAQRSLDIMKDPRSGPIAVVVLILHLLLKFAAIFVLLKNQQGIWLLFAPLYGRMAAVLLLIITPYARKNGLGAEMAEQSPRMPAVVILVLSALLPLLWITGVQGFVLGSINLLLFYSLRRLMLKRIGGMTGDTAGAMIEIVELFSLLSPAIMMSAI